MTQPAPRPRLVGRFLAAAFCLLASALPLAAQSNQGAVTGTVTDPQGAVVRDARVVVTNRATGQVREATTSDDGVYSISSVDPGTYRIEVTAAGFKTVVNETLEVQTSSRVPFDVRLEIGATPGEVVTVTGENQPLAESESSVRGDVITGREVVDLPIPQRNFTLLATLSPGVTRPSVGVLGGGGSFEAGNSPGGTSTESTRFRESGGSVLVVNGARPTNNNFTLDGVDNNEGQFSQIAIFAPPDVIAEFKIETSVAPAESGRAGGGIISTTTRSGGNALHGSAYEFYQGRFASALGRSENPAALPNRNTHQFGFTAGGPVFLPRFGEGTPPLYDGRNRTFWFAYYEGQRNSTPSTTGDFPFVTVPTARMRVGDFGELLQPGTARTYNTINGPVTAPRGTVFCPSGAPAPANDIRNCGVALSPAALNTLAAYPLPSEAGLIENNYRRNRKERYNRDGWGLRFDHNFGNSNSLFFAYSEDTSNRVRDNNFPAGTSPTGNDLPSGFGAGAEFGDSRGVRIGDTHTFSPTVINDLRVGATRVEIGINNPGIGGALGLDPDVSANLGHRNVNICGACEGVVLLGIEELLNGNRDGGQLEFIGDGGPFYFLSNNFSFADTLTVVKGNNTFKFGGDYRVRQNSNFDGGRNGGIKGQPQYGTGVGGFLAGNYAGIPIGPRDAGSGVANFLFGNAPAFYSRGTPGGPYFQSNRELSFFAQDDWKVSQNLTLNLGLRWDMFTQPTERFDRQTNFDPATNALTRAGDGATGGRDLVDSDLNNFGPRMGFAWSGLRDDKTVVLRGGYGILYAVDIPGIPGILSTNPPGGANYSCTLQNYGTANCPQLPARFNLDTGTPFPVEVIGIQPGQSFTPPAGVTLVSLERDISNELFHQFNFTGQWEFRRGWLAEAGYVGSRGRNLLIIRNIGQQGAGGFPGSREVAGRDIVQRIEYSGDSSYDSLQTKLERRFSDGLSIISSYVFSRAEDNSPGAFCLGGTGPRTCGFSNPLQPELDRARSDFDTPHRFNFASVWDLPFGNGRRFLNDLPGALNFFVGGWQFNNNITIQSGPPFTVTANGVRADFAAGAGACPAGGTAKQLGGQFFCPARQRVFPGDPDLNGDGTLASVPRFGTVPRNAFRGDRQEYWDTSLFKNIRVPQLGEQFNVQLRIQAYNVLNHVNGFRPRNDLNDSLFGIDTNEQRRRQLEFGFRLQF
ncbi:MAG TPA: TonB-dependent receptor [Pyrinomonadaceae bacterium]